MTRILIIFEIAEDDWERGCDSPSFSRHARHARQFGVPARTTTSQDIKRLRSLNLLSSNEG